MPPYLHNMSHGLLAFISISETHTPTCPNTLQSAGSTQASQRERLKQSTVCSAMQQLKMEHCKSYMGSISDLPQHHIETPPLHMEIDKGTKACICNATICNVAPSKNSIQTWQEAVLAIMVNTQHDSPPWNHPKALWRQQATAPSQHTYSTGKPRMHAGSTCHLTTTTATRTPNGAQLLYCTTFCAPLAATRAFALSCVDAMLNFLFSVKCFFKGVQNASATLEF